MLLAERILMLDRQMDGSAWDKERLPSERNHIAAVSCLVELALMRRLDDVVGSLHVSETQPGHSSVLADAHGVLIKRKLKISEASQYLSKAMPNLATELLQSMARRGLLLEEKQRRFLVLQHTRYPVQSTSSYAANVALVRGGAQALSLTELEPLSLVLVSDCIGVLRRHLPAEAMAPIEARLSRFEQMLSASRVASDPHARLVRLVFQIAQGLRQN